MLVSDKWLRTLVETETAPEEMAERFVLAGIENNLLRKEAGAAEKVVVGKILCITPHPGADKLVICQVDIGKESLQVVTGATNIAVGDRVPVALPGARLPGGVKIEATQFRGVASQGMLCAPDELGIGLKDLPQEQREGIMLLPSDVSVGDDIRRALDLDDIVYELELTPNRPDCLSMIGVAYEAAALTGGRLGLPEITVRSEGAPVENLAGLEIRDGDLCPRCVVRVIRDISIGPSPYWMQQRLRSAGIRPINNIVDVTNYVMMEMGQPLHAYDYDTLAGHKIIVRRAAGGEKITTLDGSDLELDAGMLVIADDNGPVGLAGVMGGLATEITDKTRTVLLEAACFDGISIRKTYKQFDLRSEAAVRFEKGVDPNNCGNAADRAVQLIAAMGAGKPAPGRLDIYPKPAVPAQISLRVARVNWLLGTELTADDIKAILGCLRFVCESGPDGELIVTVPTRRALIAAENDLIEEIARVYGFNNIAGTLPHGNTAQGTKRYDLQVEGKARDILTGCGMLEVVTFSFQNPNDYDRLRLPGDSPLRRLIPLLNPMTEDQAVLRTTLLASLLEVVKYNTSRQISDLLLYEIANVYRAENLPLTQLPEQRSTLACAAVGYAAAAAWNRAPEPLDFYVLKGILEKLLDGLRVSDYHFVPAVFPPFHPGRTAAVELAGRTIGYLGEVHPKVLEEYGIEQKTVMSEIDLMAVTAAANLVPRYRPLPRFPATTRDIAVLVDDTVKAGELLTLIREAGGELLESAVLFDVYSGGKIPAGKKSLAYSLTYRAEDKTLTDAEVEEAHKRILAVLGDKTGARLR